MRLIHSRYGFALASAFLSSVSSMIRPASVSIRNMRPGCSRHFLTMRDSGIGSTPASDASTTRSSSVIRYLAGRSPLRSSVAPIWRPSVNAIAAGPSHGSIIAAWYS